MNKKYTIKENHLFTKLYKSGRSTAKGCVAVYLMKNYNKNYTGITRYGITVSKKMGCAPKRNRAKRLIREALRMLYPGIKSGFLFVVVARSSCMDKQTNLWKVKSSLQNALRDLGILNRP